MQALTDPVLQSLSLSGQLEVLLPEVPGVVCMAAEGTAEASARYPLAELIPFRTETRSHKGRNVLPLQPHLEERLKQQVDRHSPIAVFHLGHA